MKEKSIRITITEADLNEKSPTFDSPTTEIPQVNSQNNAPLTPSSDLNRLVYTSSPDLSAQGEQANDAFNSLSPMEFKQHTIVSHRSFEGDLESQNFDTNQTQASTSNTRLVSKTSYDPMWPNRHDLKLKRKAMKRERACCGWWAALSKKQRGIISTIIILVILGAGLSVGFGISKRVGGGVVNSRGPNAPVLIR